MTKISADYEPPAPAAGHTRAQVASPRARSRIAPCRAAAPAWCSPATVMIDVEAQQVIEQIVARRNVVEHRPMRASVCREVGQQRALRLP